MSAAGGPGANQFAGRPYKDIYNPWHDREILEWQVWTEEWWLFVLTAIFCVFGIIFAVLFILLAVKLYQRGMEEAFREYWDLEVKNAKQVYKVKRELDKERRKMREKLARARAGRMRKTVSMFLPVPGILPSRDPKSAKQMAAQKDTGDAVKGHDIGVGTDDEGGAKSTRLGEPKTETVHIHVGGRKRFSTASAFFQPKTWGRARNARPSGELGTPSRVGGEQAPATLKVSGERHSAAAPRSVQSAHMDKRQRKSMFV